MTIISTLVHLYISHMGAGHQADGTSSRIVKLGTSSRIIPYKVVKYEQFENFFEEFLNFMIFLH